MIHHRINELEETIDKQRKEIVKLKAEIAELESRVYRIMKFFPKEDSCKVIAIKKVEQ